LLVLVYFTISLHERHTHALRHLQTGSFFIQTYDFNVQY